jgi:acetyltransferase-like isoleucine patch superfamily enzyme
MLKLIESYIIKNRLLKVHNCKIKKIDLFSKNCSFIAEEFTSLGNTKVSDTAKFIGAHSYIRSGHLENVDRIGRYCSIGPNVLLGQDANNHPLHWCSTHNKLTGYDIKNNALVISAGLDIGNDVWIGSNVTIMSGIKIGDGAVVGAGAIVTKDVEPYQVVAGVPAKPIKYRFDKAIRDELLTTEWWNKSYDFLKTLDYSNIQMFIQSVNNDSSTAKFSKVLIKCRTRLSKC